MSILKKREATGPNGEHLYNQWFWWCPGCDKTHIFADGPNGWTFNGDTDKPTVQPSILSRTHIHNQPGCHVFLTDGMIHYLPDSWHALAGQTVPMVELPDWLAREGEGHVNG